MTLLKSWLVIILSVFTFDFALPFACAWYAKSIIIPEREMVSIQAQYYVDNIHYQKVSQETNQNKSFWNEDLLSEEYINDTDPGTSTFIYTEEFNISPELKNNLKANSDLLRSKIINGNKVIAKNGFISSGFTDISYFTNPENNSRYVKITYRIVNNLSNGANF